MSSRKNDAAPRVERPPYSPDCPFLRERALPNSDHHPAFLAQRDSHAPVALSISLNSLSPELHIAGWDTFASWASVPETAIYEEGDL